MIKILNKIKILLSMMLIFSLITTYAFSQNDYQLANQYFSDGEYEKSAVLYEKLFNETSVKYYFDYYLKSMMELKNYEDAEKKVKKLQKKNPTDMTYYIDLGYISAAQNKTAEKEEKYNYVLNNLGKDKNIILTIANAFITKEEYEWAEKIYNQAYINTNQTYHYQLANLYAIQMKKDLMIREYLFFVIENPSQMSTIKNTFEYYLNNDVNNEFSEMLRKTILEYLQLKHNENIVELFIWYYLQEQDYYGAYIQAKALDLRNKEIGARVYTIAETALAGADYSTAAEAYQYVINKGSGFLYYKKSRLGLLKVLYLQVTNNLITTDADIKNLEDSYLGLIKDEGINATTIDIVNDLAHLQAFYLQKPQEAITMLEEAVLLTTLNFQQKGKSLIELGDILLLTEDVWGATLAYAKAENENIGNDIGDLAKFKKAKIYYFTGNFTWAQAQLDVLKASTSKLISNDALDLVKLIKEALAEDSVANNLKNFARAELWFEQNRTQNAILSADSLIENFKNSQIIDNALFLKYKIFLAKNDREKKIENLELIVNSHAWGDVADKALFLLAQIYEKELDNKEKAMELYKKLMMEYQGSLYVIEARAKYRELRGDFAQ